MVQHSVIVNRFKALTLHKGITFQCEVIRSGSLSALPGETGGFVLRPKRSVQRAHPAKVSPYKQAKCHQRHRQHDTEQKVGAQRGQPRLVLTGAHSSSLSTAVNASLGTDTVPS